MNKDWHEVQRSSCLLEAVRRAREHGCEPGKLQWKWRTEPPPYRADQEWNRECVAAILDALNHEGVVAWDGDAVSCVAQIIAAYAQRAHEKSGR